MSNQLAGRTFKEDGLTIQHDWQRSLESDKDKFFVNLKKFGEKTVSFDIKCEAGHLKQDDDEKVKGEVNGKIIVLNTDNLSRKFIAPYIEFGSVHKGSINSVDVSPSENMMVSSDTSGELIVSDTRRANRLRDLEGHIYEVYCSRFFPSGMVVLSGGMDMTVRIFSVEDAWNARTMKGHKAPVHDLGFIGEGAEVVSCSKDGTIKVWSCSSGDVVHDFHPEIGQLHSLSVSGADSNLIGVGGESKKAVIYDIRSGKQIHSFDVDSSCNAVSFSSEIGFYAGTEDGSLFSYDLRNQKNSTLIKTQRGNVHSLLYNEIIGLIAGFHDGTVACYKNSLDGGQSYMEFTGSDCDPIYDLSIAGSTLATASVLLKTAKFKPKIAKIKPVKTPSTLALDNFDFYYGPLFADQWPSIRLGLLTPNKFVAVMNRFSVDYEVNSRIVKDLGTANIMDFLISGDPGRIAMKLEKKKAEISRKPFQGIEGEEYTEEQILGKSELQEGEGRSGRSELDNDQEPEELDMRLEGGIHEFKQSSETYTMGELNLELKDKSKKLKELEVTGVERFNGNLLKKEDFLMYPRGLRLFSFPENSLLDFPGPIKDKKDISSWWLLDGGSVLPVLALDLRIDDNVLDMCAAPGGKSLLIAQTGLFQKLTCADAKLSRIGQLRRGLAMYIPPDAPESERIIIKRRDGGRLDGWTDEGIYDKVLVDAPCSTDRLSVSQDEYNLFSPSMTQTRLNLPQLQVKLVVNALRSLKVGGSVVYSTCTLSPMQNDAVIENAAVIAEKEFGIKCVERTLVQLQRHLQPSGLYRFAQNCQRGLLVVPNLKSNFGPMYVCKLQRIK